MKNLIIDIYEGFREFPLWVQIWVALILVPVNAASLFFIHSPNGVSIAVLAIGGMLPNLWILLTGRGWPKMMAVPHVIIWTPLLFILWPQIGVSGFALVLFVVNAISLVFDFKDTWDLWSKRTKP